MPKASPTRSWSNKLGHDIRGMVKLATYVQTRLETEQQAHRLLQEGFHVQAERERDQEREIQELRSALEAERRELWMLRGVRGSGVGCSAGSESASGPVLHGMQRTLPRVLPILLR